MALNQDVLLRRQNCSVQNSVSAFVGRNYDELSSSGVDSDWILFSPSMNEYTQRSVKNHESDILSTSFNNEEHSESEEDDYEEEDDDKSLLDSLNTDSPIKLSFPIHDSGYFHTTYSKNEENEYISSLKNNDFVTNRIDSWRKEQARLMIDDLKRGSDTESCARHTNDLLASWGVDDRNLTESTNSKKYGTENHEYKELKRFYGDEMFQLLTPWEVKKIKQVATKMSLSLQRKHQYNDSNDQSILHHLPQRSAARLLLLHNFPKYSTNKLSLGLNFGQPFWKKDLSSAHSSLSLSTNSIMFGHVNLGDVV